MASSIKVTINDAGPTLLAAGVGNVTVASPYGFFIGGLDVSVENGFPVPAGVIFSVQIGPGATEELYGISASGDVDVRMLKTAAV